MNCKECGLEMIPQPVSGAARFPRRLECPTHGYPSERRSTMAVSGKTSPMAGHSDIVGQCDEVIVAENYKPAYGTASKVGFSSRDRNGTEDFA